MDEPDGDGNDKLSLALHKLSHRLVSFSLLADVGPEILWPSALTVDGTKSSPPWQLMQQYSISPGAIAPSGRWLYVRRSDASEYESDDDDDSDALSWTSDMQPGPGNEKEDSFREQLDPDAAGPWLVAAARAASRMPEPRSISFKLNPPGFGFQLNVQYSVTQNTAHSTHGYSAGTGLILAKLTIETHPILNPDERVMQAWREAARKLKGNKSHLVLAIKDCTEWRLR